MTYYLVEKIKNNRNSSYRKHCLKNAKDKIRIGINKYKTNKSKRVLQSKIYLFN